MQRAMPRRGPLVQHVLESLENAGKEKVTMPLTIEHVLPQTRNLPPDWQMMLGSDWKDAHERCVQRLGNLTLTAYNSELGARPLREKQEIPGGYRASKAVWLNSDLRAAETWNDTMLRYEHLGSYSACRDFAWRMCRQVEPRTGRGIAVGRDVELWMPDSAVHETD